MTLKKTLTALTFGVLTFIMAACSTSPSELADEYRNAKAKLDSETDSAKRDAIFSELSEIENRARNSFSTDDFKEYARIAHPADKQSADEKAE